MDCADDLECGEHPLEPAQRKRTESTLAGLGLAVSSRDKRQRGRSVVARSWARCLDTRSQKIALYVELSSDQKCDRAHCRNSFIPSGIT